MAQKPNSDFRENPARAIYVTGKLDQGLVDRLTPRINELRLSNGEPITAYIDSPGGGIQYAEFIRRGLSPLPILTITVVDSSRLSQEQP